VPTAIKVLRLVARARPGGIVVSWQTASERDRLGFNLHRQRRGKPAKLNRVLIPSVFGGTTTAHSYSWLDRNAQGGVNYSYRLQVCIPLSNVLTSRCGSRGGGGDTTMLEGTGH
jgi:hypothetical protein